jgi:hypothetical protein
MFLMLTKVFWCFHLFIGKLKTKKTNIVLFYLFGRCRSRDSRRERRRRSDNRMSSLDFGISNNSE